MSKTTTRRGRKLGSKNNVKTTSTATTVQDTSITFTTNDVSVISKLVKLGKTSAVVTIQL